MNNNIKNFVASRMATYSQEQMADETLINKIDAAEKLMNERTPDELTDDEKSTLAGLVAEIKDLDPTSEVAKRGDEFLNNANDTNKSELATNSDMNAYAVTLIELGAAVFALSGIVALAPKIVNKFKDKFTNWKGNNVKDTLDKFIDSYIVFKARVDAKRVKKEDIDSIVDQFDDVTEVIDANLKYLSSDEINQYEEFKEKFHEAMNNAMGTYSVFGAVAKGLSKVGSKVAGAGKAVKSSKVGTAVGKKATAAKDAVAKKATAAKTAIKSSQTGAKLAAKIQKIETAIANKKKMIADWMTKMKAQVTGSPKWTKLKTHIENAQKEISALTSKLAKIKTQGK